MIVQQNGTGLPAAMEQSLSPGLIAMTSDHQRVADNGSVVGGGGGGVIHSNHNGAAANMERPNNLLLNSPGRAFCY